MKKIPINIWDDYYGDGYVPENEKQETYIYIDDVDSNIDEKSNLELLLNLIEINNLGREATFKLFFNDTSLKYPNLVGTENESLLFKRWEITVTNLSHLDRERLVKDLNKIDSPFIIYSES